MSSNKITFKKANLTPQQLELLWTKTTTSYKQVAHVQEIEQRTSQGGRDYFILHVQWLNGRRVSSEELYVTRDAEDALTKNVKLGGFYEFEVVKYEGPQYISGGRTRSNTQHNVIGIVELS